MLVVREIPEVLGALEGVGVGEEGAAVVLNKGLKACVLHLYLGPTFRLEEIVVQVEQEAEVRLAVFLA
jgi:hypothetical protein